MRRLLLLVLAAAAVLTPGRAFATAPPDSSGDGAATATPTTIDNSFLDTKRNLTDCLNNSVDLPDCGIQPTEPGERGGALQLATFFVMFLGIGVISWRVTKSVRARDRALESAPYEKVAAER
jgi:hypothetical protein